MTNTCTEPAWREFASMAKAYGCLPRPMCPILDPRWCGDSNVEIECSSEELVRVTSWSYSSFCLHVLLLELIVECCEDRAVACLKNWLPWYASGYSFELGRIEFWKQFVSFLNRCNHYDEGKGLTRLPDIVAESQFLEEGGRARLGVSRVRVSVPSASVYYYKWMMIMSSVQVPSDLLLGAYEMSQSNLHRKSPFRRGGCLSWWLASSVTKSHLYLTAKVNEMVGGTIWGPSWDAYQRKRKNHDPHHLVKFSTISKLHNWNARD